MAYIEKEKAQVFLRTECLAKYPASFANGLLAAADILKKIPAADVVEAVRCRDCKWYGVDSTKGQFCRRPLSPSMWRDDVTPLKPDDYCSYGERREKE